MVYWFMSLAFAYSSNLWLAGEARGLDIYFIDMVGGAATLIVTPMRESILVDCGQQLQRDADRIHHVVHDVAGLSQIDHMVTTHWHLDHYGAVSLLKGRLAFKRFYDRGIPSEVPEDPKNFPRLIAAYKEAAGGRSVTMRAGDAIRLKQGGGPALTFRCLMANGELADGADAGRPNPHCNEHVEKKPDTSDNGKSLVTLLSFGKFEFLNPGDLTWNFEKKLVCPVNRVGRMDLFQVSHHGLAASSNPVFVHALEPRVAVLCNGPTKGGHPDVVRTLRSSPGLADLWALHRNWKSAASDNAERDRVANWDNRQGGEYIKVSVHRSGEAFTVQIGEPGSPVRYDCRE